MDALISKEFIDLNIQNRTKEKALSQMIDMLIAENRISNKAEFMEAVLEREKQTSTAIGFDVGIPHGKSDAVNKATVVFARSAKGIRWNETGEIVKLIFLLAIPTKEASNKHLKILANLSRKLLDDQFINLLKTGKDQGVIIQKLEETLAGVNK